MNKLPEHIRMELEEIELPWLEIQVSRGRVRVDGVDVVTRLRELREILASDDEARNPPPYTVKRTRRRPPLGYNGRVVE